MLNSHDFFYKKFKSIYVRLINNIQGNVDFKNKSKIVQNIFNRIFFLYFLCDKELLKANGVAISGKKFFSNEIMNNGQFLENFNNFLSFFINPCKKVMIINFTQISCPCLKGDLFVLSDLEKNLEIKISKKDWENLFNFLNEFDWIIDDNTHNFKNIRYSNSIITPKIFSYLHERLSTEGEKKSRGVYYTPLEISNYICRRTIYSFILNDLGFKGDEVFQIEEILQNENDQGIIKDISRKLREIKILDPACGTGVFLIKAAEILFNLITYLNLKLNTSREPFDIKQEIIINNLYGTDINSSAIEITKIRIWLWLLSSHPNDSNHRNLPNIDYNIISGNSLIGWNYENFMDIPPVNLNQKINPLIDELTSLVNPEVGALILKNISKLKTGEFSEQVKAYHKIKKLYIRGLPETEMILKQVIIILRENFIESIDKSHLNIIQNELDNEKYHIGRQEFLRHQPFHWKFEFEPIFKNNGFDIIIGNPPYVFIRGMKFGKFERNFFKRRYLKNYQPLTKGKAKQSGKLNAFSLFLIRSIELLKSGGNLGFILPNTLLRTSTNDIVRQYLMEHSQIKEIVDLGGSVFKGVTASTIILILKKNVNKIKEKLIIKHEVKDLLNNKYLTHEINQNRFYENITCCFNIHVNHQFEQLFDKMKFNTFELGEITSEILEGLVTRKNDNLFTSNPNKLGAKKLIRGKNIERFKINWPEGQYIIYDPSRLHRARSKHVHEAPEKLLSQRIGGGIYPIQVAYDDEQYYYFASANAIILKNPPIIDNYTYDIKYILAILNSKLMNGYYLLNYSNRSEFTVNITKTFIKAIPIKKVNTHVQKNVSCVVNYIIYLKKFHPSERIIKYFFDQNILDSLIYEIYFPSEFDTNLNDIITPYIKLRDKLTIYPFNLDAIKKSFKNMKEDQLLQEQVKKIKKNPITMMINDLFKKRSDKLYSI